MCNDTGGTMKGYVLLAGLAAVLMMSGCAVVTMPLVPRAAPLKEKTLQGRGRDKILLVDISGIVSSEDRETLGGLSRRPDHVSLLKEELERAAGDSRIRALVVRINSPGGSVTASDIMYRELLGFKKRRGVPVIACCMDIAASGGYYIAMAADSVYAHPTSVVGSIGVIAMKFNVKGLLDKIGVIDETITSAALKDSMSPFRGMSEQERAIMQDILDEMHARFTDVVSEGRKGLSRRQVADLADGRVFTASQALEAGLVDRIGYLDDAIGEAEKRAGLPRGARIVMYHRPSSYKNNIYSQTSINVLSLAADLPDRGLPLRFMYLWNP